MYSLFCYLICWLYGFPEKKSDKIRLLGCCSFLYMVLIALPVDLFLLMSGALNYTWSAVLCLAFLLVYTKVRQMERVNWGVAFLLFLLASFLVGHMNLWL